MMEEEINILKEFLMFPLWRTNEIFDKFRTVPNNVFREEQNSDCKCFIYIEGTRDDKVVLIAHADTVFFDYGEPCNTHTIKEENGYFVNGDFGCDVGIGADDRAGCAILWLLKDMGHSILIVDGEERGCCGSDWLMTENKDIADKINSHNFMVQLDRCNSNDFKCYSVGTDEFRDYIHQKTGYVEPNRFSYTDIVKLCDKICGVNFSVGYYDEHTQYESLNIKEWCDTLNMLKTFLGEELPKFKLI